MHARGARFERREAVDRPHVAIAVAVPVDADAAAHLVDDLSREVTTARAPAGVAWPTVSAMQMRDAPARIAVVNRRRSVSGSERVVSSVTYITSRPWLTPNDDGLLRAPLQVVDRPVLRVAADGARPDEAAAFDRQPDALRRRRRSAATSLTTVRAAQFGRIFSFDVDDLARQPLDVADDVRAGAGQADVGGVDADLVEQPQDAELLIDGRRAHRRRLQPVAQRLVVEHDDRRRAARRVAIPVVDECLVHDASASPRLHWHAAQPATRTTPPQSRPCWTDRRIAGRMISSTVTACPCPASAVALQRDVAPCAGGGHAILHDREDDKRGQRGRDDDDRARPHSHQFDYTAPMRWSGHLRGSRASGLDRTLLATRRSQAHP